jgi:hypothetical protein
MTEPEEKKSEPWYEHEDCEDCREEAESAGIEYEANFTWEGDIWVCDTCNRPQ